MPRRALPSPTWLFFWGWSSMGRSTATGSLRVGRRALLLAAVAVALSGSVGAAEAPSVRLVSKSQGAAGEPPSTTAAGTSNLGSDWESTTPLSADGRFLVFTSTASNLVAGEPDNDRLNIFV